MEALALPGESEPEAAIVIFFFAEINTADNLPWIGLQTEGPVPSFAALYGGKRQIANEVKRPVSRIRPWDLRGQVAHDLPLRKQNLNLFGVCELERAQ
jgi:hypothetical protein